MKTIFKTAQIGGKGSMRRKIKKKKTIKMEKLTYHEGKLIKLANRFNNIEVEKKDYETFNKMCYDKIIDTINTFTKKYYYKKQVIENKQQFINENLLCVEENKKIQFITNFTTLKLYFSPKGFDSLIDCYFSLWDNIMNKKYILQ